MRRVQTGVNAEKSASATEDNSHRFTALIVLSSLLAVSVLANITLAAAVLHIKGKLSSCMKGEL